VQRAQPTAPCLNWSPCVAGENALRPLPAHSRTAVIDTSLKFAFSSASVHTQALSTSPSIKSVHESTSSKNINGRSPLLRKKKEEIGVNGSLRSSGGGSALRASLSNRLSRGFNSSSQVLSLVRVTLTSSRPQIPVPAFFRLS